MIPPAKFHVVSRLLADFDAIVIVPVALPLTRFWAVSLAEGFLTERVPQIIKTHLLRLSRHVQTAASNQVVVGISRLFPERLISGRKNPNHSRQSVKSDFSAV